MIDYNRQIPIGDYSNNLVNVVVEIPMGSTDKIEWNPVTKNFEVDRKEPSSFVEPINYGFIPKTIGGDGDNLDALVVFDGAIPTGTVVKARVLGVMNFLDENEVDDKIVVVPAIGNDLILSVDDLSEQKVKEIEYHFGNYKEHKKPGSTSILGWAGIDEATKIITESVERWNGKEAK